MIYFKRVLYFMNVLNPTKIERDRNKHSCSDNYSKIINIKFLFYDEITSIIYHRTIINNYNAKRNYMNQ